MLTHHALEMRGAPHGLDQSAMSLAYRALVLPLPLDRLGQPGHGDAKPADAHHVAGALTVAVYRDDLVDPQVVVHGIGQRQGITRQRARKIVGGV